jgi:ABC-type antimicrobial peptide transport system permease subunit
MSNDTTGPVAEVVGVARDVKYRNVREEPRPSFYLPAARFWEMRSGILHVRTEGDPAAMLGTIRRVVAEVNPHVAIGSALTLDDQLSLNVNRERVTMVIGVALGATALVLSAVGLFGAMATLVAGRRRELGVRLALGAVPWEIGRLVLRDGLALAAWGGAIGVALAVWLGRTIEAQLYGVEPLDAISLGAAFSLLTLIAIVAALVPARWATRVDPVEALRVE